MSLTREEVEQDDHEASLFAMTLGTGAVTVYVLKAIIELDVLEVMKKAGPAAQFSPAEIVAQLPVTNPGAAGVLDRMLRLLASLSVLTFSLRARPDGGAEGVYGLGPVCKYLTKTEDGGCFAPVSLLINDKAIADTLNNLKDSVVEGAVPFQKTHGMSIFEYIGKYPKFHNTFYNAMNGHTAVVVKKILERYKGFEGLSSLVDVGGGTGDTLRMIVSNYPNMKAINFDMPHVVKDAPFYPGVEHVGGDMYLAIPTADAIFMKWMLHGGSNEQCLQLLKNCHVALPKHGKVILCEYVKPDVPETSSSARLAFTLDNLMLAVSGGKERTKQDYEALGRQAGFQHFHLICNVYDSWVMEFCKNE